MSEYCYIANIDDKEYICGVDIREKGIAYSLGIKVNGNINGDIIPRMLTLLLSNTSTFGKHAWFGKRIKVSGDSASVDDKTYYDISQTDRANWKNITEYVIEVWNNLKFKPELEFHGD